MENFGLLKICLNCGKNGAVLVGWCFVFGLWFLRKCGVGDGLVLQLVDGEDMCGKVKKEDDDNLGINCRGTIVRCGLVVGRKEWKGFCWGCQKLYGKFLNGCR